MDIVAGNVGPLDIVRVEEVQHCVMVGNERNGVLFSYLAVAVLYAGAVVLGHCDADDARIAGVLPYLADKSLVCQLVYRVVLGLVVDREVDEHQVGVVAKHLRVAAVYADVGACRADTCVDVVHLCIGVLALYPLCGERSVAVFVISAGPLGDGAAKVSYGDFLACLELPDDLSNAHGIALGIHQQREHVLRSLCRSLLVQTELILDSCGEQVGLHCDRQSSAVCLTGLFSRRAVRCGGSRAVVSRGAVCVIWAV